MKKTISLLLALVMCLSLAACGNAEKPKQNETENDYTGVSTNQTENTDSTDYQTEYTAPTETEPKVQVVEITMDNWQDYFEIKQCVEGDVNTNAFDEFESVAYYIYTVFTLKEEYAEKIDTDESQLAIEYSCNYKSRSYTLNATDFTYEITGDGLKDELHNVSVSGKTNAAFHHLSFPQETMIDGKVVKNNVEFPFAANLVETPDAAVSFDNREEWQEEYEGVGCILEDIEITRIQGSITLFE